MEYNVVIEDKSSHCTTVVPAFPPKCVLGTNTCQSQIKLLNMPKFLQRSRTPAVTSQYSNISQTKLIVKLSAFSRFLLFSDCNNSADF